MRTCRRALKALHTPHRGWYSRGYLPHFDAAAAVQSITFRLGDSIPREKILEWETELKTTLDHGKRDIEFRKKIETYADAGHGACHLRDERIAAVVQNALLYFDGRRYQLLEWVVMPNHVHALIEEQDGHTLQSIVHSWKSFSAREANRILKRDGEFWQPEYFDRFIRGEEHYFFTARYIRENPVKAGLCKHPEEWRFGSAWEREQRGPQAL